MQSVFGINMVALVQGQPRLLNLREILDAFIGHRREVVTRRTCSTCARPVTGPTCWKA
jgi:DNA gyrase subunit A